EYEAVHGERHQRARLEVAREEAHRNIRRESGGDAADDHLAADVVAVVPEKIRKLVDARRKDDRRGEHEREARGILVVEAAEKTRNHRHAGPADAGEEGEDLCTSDEDALAELEGVEITA